MFAIARRAIWLFVLMLGGVVWAQTPEAPDWIRYSSALFKGCPREGRGGDSYSNTLKNRNGPPDQCEKMTVPEMLQWHPEVVVAQGRKHRSNWNRDALSSVLAMERRGVTVPGYFIDAKVEGPEACNCYAEDQLDIHLWLAEHVPTGGKRQLAAQKNHAVVTEVSPRVRDSNNQDLPRWTIEQIDRLIQQHTQVRVGGWLFWDNEHAGRKLVGRGTLLEIHPIHKIEYWDGARWVKL